MPPVEPPTPTPAALEALGRATGRLITTRDAEPYDSEAWLSALDRFEKIIKVGEDGPELILWLLAAARRGGEDTERIVELARTVVESGYSGGHYLGVAAAPFHALKSALSAAHPGEENDDAK
jgi:hypothetical protein